MPPQLIASPLAPLVVQAPVPSAHGRRLTHETQPRADEWWRWANPTRLDALEGRKEWSPRTKKTHVSTRVEARIVGSWRVGNSIGHGASGKVRIARHTRTGEFAAIKRILKPNRDSKHWAVIEREIIMMKLAEHPRVLRLLDVFETPTHLQVAASERSSNIELQLTLALCSFILSELCVHGELYSEIIRNRPSKSLSRRWFGQLVAAVAHLHVLSIAHRDIKPENLLLVKDRDGLTSIKLGDFGMSSFQASGTLLDTSCGSPHYAAPEIIRGIEYDGLSADIWSTGVVLFALLAGRLPFDDDNIPSLMRKIKVGVFRVPSSVDEQARDLIRKMMVVKPHILEVAEHPYLASQPLDDAFALPYPLATNSHQARSPVFASELDKHIISNLKIVLRESSDQRVVDAILKEHAPKMFYVCLRNFKTRPQSVEESSDLEQLGRIPLSLDRRTARTPSLEPPSRRSSFVAPSPPPPFPLPRLPSGAMSNPLPDKTWAQSVPPVASSSALLLPQHTENLTFPLIAPRRLSWPTPSSAEDVEYGTHGKPRTKKLSFKIKGLFGSGRQRDNDATPLPTRPQFAVLRDAPLPPLPSSTLATDPCTPVSPLPANARSVKRSVGYASLARAAIGLGPSSPSPSHSQTPPELKSLTRKKSAISLLNPVSMVKGSWLDPRSHSKATATTSAGENRTPAQKEASPSSSPESSPPKRRRPAPLRLLSSNHIVVTAADPRSPLSDQSNSDVGKDHHLSPRPSADPFTLLSVIQPTPTTPFSLAPHSAPLPTPPRPVSTSALEGHVGSRHKATGSVVVKLEAENRLLRAALEIKDDEIDALLATKQRQSAKCDQLEEEKDELTERIKRMSFETSKSVERRWSALLRDAEEGRLSDSCPHDSV